MELISFLNVNLRKQELSSQPLLPEDSGLTQTLPSNQLCTPGSPNGGTKGLCALLEQGVFPHLQFA